MILVRLEMSHTDKDRRDGPDSEEQPPASGESSGDVMGGRVRRSQL